MSPTKSLSCASILRKVHPTNAASPAGSEPTKGLPAANLARLTPCEGSNRSISLLSAPHQSGESERSNLDQLKTGGGLADGRLSTATSYGGDSVDIEAAHAPVIGIPTRYLDSAPDIRSPSISVESEIKPSSAAVGISLTGKHQPDRDARLDKSTVEAPVGLARPEKGTEQVQEDADERKQEKDDEDDDDGGDDEEEEEEEEEDGATSLDRDLETRIVSDGDRFQFESYSLSATSDRQADVGELARFRLDQAGLLPALVGAPELAPGKSQRVGSNKQVASLDCKLCNMQSSAVSKSSGRHCASGRCRSRLDLCRLTTGRGCCEQCVCKICRSEIFPLESSTNYATLCPSTREGYKWRHSKLSSGSTGCPECARLPATKRSSRRSSSRSCVAFDPRQQLVNEPPVLDNKLPILRALTCTRSLRSAIKFNDQRWLTTDQARSKNGLMQANDFMFPFHQSTCVGSAPADASYPSTGERLLDAGHDRKVSRKLAQKLTFQDHRFMLGGPSSGSEEFSNPDQITTSRSPMEQGGEIHCSIVGLGDHCALDRSGVGVRSNGSNGSSVHEPTGTLIACKNILIKWLNWILDQVFCKQSNSNSTATTNEYCHEGGCKMSADQDIEISLPGKNKSQNFSPPSAFSRLKSLALIQGLNPSASSSRVAANSSNKSRGSRRQLLSESPSRRHGESILRVDGLTASKNGSSTNKQTSNTSKNNLNSSNSSTKPSYSSHHPIQPKSERKAAKTLSTLLLVFIVTWLPYDILVLIKTLSGGESLVPEKVWNFSYYLCYINSTINPLCYALCNAQFRRTYMRILKCKLSTEHNSSRRLVPIPSSTTWNKDFRMTSDSNINNTASGHNGHHNQHNSSSSLRHNRAA